MGQTAEATKDHLNEHSLLEQPAWLPITRSQASATKRQKGSIDSRIRSVLSQCGVSAMAVLCYGHGTRVYQSTEAASTPGHFRPLIKPYVIGDVRHVRTMSRERDLCVGRVTRRRKKNQTQQAEKNQNFQIPLSYTTLPYHC